MTSQGTPQGRSQRAIDNSNLWAAETAARELGRLPLGSALALTALIADVAPQRFERAAGRWQGRFVLEVPGLTIAESQLALGAVASLRGGDRSTAVWVLGELGGAHGAPNVTLGRPQSGASGVIIGQPSVPLVRGGRGEGERAVA